MKSLSLPLLILFGCNFALAQSSSEISETLALVKRANEVLEKLKEKPDLSYKKSTLSLFDQTNPQAPMRAPSPIER